jgi:putative transposase
MSRIWHLGALQLVSMEQRYSQRRPPGELLSHSDRGSQYASNEYRAVLAENDVTCSMSGSGDCRNNAVVESFNGTIKRELINWNRWETRSAATMAIAEYIEGWYNLRRRHSEARVRQPRAV